MRLESNSKIAPGSDVPVAVNDSRSEQEQIAELRARAIERSKAAQGTEWSFGWPASHYVDRAGPGTSPYDFGTLKTEASIVELPADYQKFSVTALQLAVNARIAALGLDPVKVFRWAVEFHSEEESRRVRHLTLAQKIEEFRGVR
jgi:hypothetical protein